MNISLDHVSKSIKGANVLTNISMNLESGKIIGFRGVNGSGKTMLMRVISGLIYPSTGTVKINDQILGKDISFPESIGMLIETPAFLDDYSGMENLRILASIRKRITDRDIEDVIKRVGLDPHNKKSYKKYSLGMKQRLGIAAAVMEKPELILLDEPTNALDVDGVKMVQNILLAEKSRNALIVLCCHDPEILNTLADEIYHIQEGKVTNHQHKEDNVSKT